MRPFLRCEPWSYEKMIKEGAENLMKVYEAQLLSKLPSYISKINEQGHRAEIICRNRDEMLNVVVSCAKEKKSENDIKQEMSFCMHFCLHRC